MKKSIVIGVLVDPTGSEFETDLRMSHGISIVALGYRVDANFKKRPGVTAALDSDLFFLVVQYCKDRVP